MMQKLLTVGVLLFDDVEVLDFAGPFEVFSVARKVNQNRDGEQLFTVVTIAEKKGIVTATGGLPVKPHYTINNHPALDILLIPGGWGSRREKDNKKVLDWIKKQNQLTQLTASVCTGAFLLAELGLLDGKKATTHWASVAWMKKTYPQITMTDDNKRFVDEGHIITSAGISAGIDMSLYIVKKIYGKAVAEWTAQRMEYEWRR